jgi:ceramide glucosyltransferase
MDWYFYIALVIILSQISFLVLTYFNYHYVMSKYKKPRTWYRPRTVLLVPCRNLDSDFQKNITSFYNLDYENYLLWFVVADKSDPAYDQLCILKDQLVKTTKALDVRILVAGQGKFCSQKIHNLLYCYEQITGDIEVLAFADSDICVKPDWLSHLVYLLYKSDYGAASGYRWFVPKTNNLATIALSAINAKIAQQLGKSPFNLTWGGSMAIKVDVFRSIGLDKIWQKALSDDLSLSYAVKKARLKVGFVPACLVASYESTTWPELFEFGRRQFLITRVFTPGIWLFGLLTGLYSVLGLWGTAALAFYAVKINAENAALFISVPIVFFASQMARAVLRQVMIARLLQKDLPKMKFVIVSDILFFWLWSLLMLGMIISSSVGRTICWRGIRYKLISPTETIVLDH